MSSSQPSAGESRESDTPDANSDEQRTEPLEAPTAGTAADPSATTRVPDDTTASQELVTPLANLSGRRLLHFQVHERLGAGAMSSVYRATDERTGQKVALKVLLPGADGVARSRFQQEADTALQLEHPHIIRTLEIGAIDDEGLAVICMQLVDGDSLADLLERNRQLSIFDACLILEQVARALDYAHRRGIVHRDVKPSNILLQPADPETPDAVSVSVLEDAVVPLLSDFGIARALDAPELTTVGRTVGTPSYMAPEQCSGSHDVDGRADIYALGTVLYRCLVGKPPFVGTTTQVLYAHVYSPLMIPDEVLVNLPMPVIDILRRSLTKEPDQRYATAAAMAIDMAKITGGVKVAPGEGAVDMDEITSTMTAIPATNRTTSASSTVLVPSRSSAQPLPQGAGSGGPLTVPQATAAKSRQQPRRELNRVAIGAGLTLAALLVILTIAVVRNLMPSAQTQLAGVVGVATPAPVSGSDSDGTGQTTDNDGNLSIPPADGRAENEEAVTPEPTGVTKPVFFAESVWNDARTAYAALDWTDTQLWLIALFRTDDEFNVALASGASPQTQLIKEMFFDQPERPFWARNAEMFDLEQIELMFLDSLMGLAAEANKSNQGAKAADLLAEAQILRPDDSDIGALVSATEELTEASPRRVPATRKALGIAYADYASSVAAKGHFCQAVTHQSTALILAAEPALGADIPIYQNRCREVIIAETADPIDLADLSGILLYSSASGGQSQIYGRPVLPGADSVLLIEEGAQPSLSPDGSRMAFYNTRPGEAGLSVINVGQFRSPMAIRRDGAVERMTRFVEDGLYSATAWAPDSDQIAYSSTREGDRQSRIFVGWSGDSETATRLGFGTDPAWQPGEPWIAYSGTDDTGNQPGIWMRLSGGDGLRQLTKGKGDIQPTWSPDGADIVFASNERPGAAQPGDWELYRLDVDAGEVSRLTDDPGMDIAPSVSPDGATVAFLSDRDGGWAIWVVALEGGKPTILAPIEGDLSNWREHSLQWVE